MTSPVVAQANPSGLGLPPSAQPGSSAPDTANGSAASRNSTSANTAADAFDALVTSTLTSTSGATTNNFPAAAAAAFSYFPAEHDVTSFAANTPRDVSETRISPDPFKQQILSPDTTLPISDPGGGVYLPAADVLPLPRDVDTVMTDASAHAVDATPPAEPVTPVQSQTQDRLLRTGRRDSTVEHNAIPFASASEASRIRNAITNNFNMMTLAQMSSPHPMGMTHLPQTPTVVTPAQVTLPNHIPDLANPFDGNMYPFPAFEEGLESFARVEFADSVFQMTTYAVIIGRDQRAMDQAKRDERRANEYQRMAEDHASMGLPPPNHAMHDRNRKFSKSYVSEEGGMLGPESDGESTARPQRKRKRTRSTGSSQQNETEQPDEQLIMDRQYVSHTPGAAAVDLKSLRPSPHHTPFIGIHSPGPDIASKTKAISREHLKIQFNAKKNVFEALPLHKNGFFCDDVHYRQESVVLRSGARLQIKDVDFTFIINGVVRGRTGAEDLEDGPARLAKPYTEGGKEMSVEFELGQTKEGFLSDSDELSELEGSPAELSDDAEARAVKSDSEMGGRDGVKKEAMSEQPPKRRGPGRPPKDGIMSKRERRELAKLEQEMERQRHLEAHVATGSSVPPEASPPGEPGEAPLKRKVGRPRKHPLPEDADDKPEKRKYKPRKPKEEEGSEAERRRERKERRLARPKSPPLKLRREDFNEDQLAKPNKNYGILIDEVLREAGPDGLILKQIYNRIAAKYPFYHFCTETKGWESSVRHNLIGNSAFSKDPKSGAWTRVLGIELDAGKKRKGDAAAAERAAAAAAASAATAALAGQQPYGTGAYGNAAYSGYGPGGHHLAPGGVQGYSQAGPGAQSYQQGQQQAGYGVVQQGGALGQAFAGQPGQVGHQPSHSPAHGALPAGATSRPASVGLSALQNLNTNTQAAASGAGSNYIRHASGTPQPNGTAAAAAAAAGVGAQHSFYGTHPPTPGLAQPANGVGLPSRQTFLPRPAVVHSGLLVHLKKFVKDLHKHKELDRRWIFSALNRVLGLKPAVDIASSSRKKTSLAESMERKLVKGLEGVVSRYVDERAKAKAKEPASAAAAGDNTRILHPDVVALFVELRGNFEKGRAAVPAAAGDGNGKGAEAGAAAETEMGEYMVLSCFDRVVGARDESIFEGLRDEGVLSGGEAGGWVAAEEELVGVVRGYVLKMGFTLTT